MTQDKHNQISFLQEQLIAVNNQLWEYDCNYDESIRCGTLKKEYHKIRSEIERLKDDHIYK
jgi:hypothetical protein